MEDSLNCNYIRSCLPNLQLPPLWQLIVSLTPHTGESDINVLQEAPVASSSHLQWPNVRLHVPCLQWLQPQAFSPSEEMKEVWIKRLKAMRLFYSPLEVPGTIQLQTCFKGLTHSPSRSNALRVDSAPKPWEDNFLHKGVVVPGKLCCKPMALSFHFVMMKKQLSYECRHQWYSHLPLNGKWRHSYEILYTDWL